MSKDTQQAKTMIEKMGFNNKDIKDEKHDKICLWLAKRENIKKMLNEIKISFNSSTSFIGANQYYWNWKEKRIIIKSEKCQYDFDEADKQRAIKNREEIEIELKRQYELTDLKRSESYEKMNLSFEEPIKGYNNFILGFIDLKINFIEDPAKPDKEGRRKEYSPFYFYNYFENEQQNSTKRIDDVFIEVKSKMPTFGEIVREIKYYKTNIFKESIWVVIAPECNFVEELKEQGILFYQYKEE